MENENRLTRSGSLLGDDVMEALARARVIIFGVGGVGSWTAESLVRTGLLDITIVDDDVVLASNINRQCEATQATLGRFKVEALRDRLLDIAPEAVVTAVNTRYTPATAGDFNLEQYDYVVDAIDSVECKAHLILEATRVKNCKLFSSMGAAMRVDPQRVKVAEFWKVEGCALARALRQRFKRSGVFPARKFQCVYSDEPPVSTPKDSIGAIVKGSVMQETAIFGLNLTALIVNDLIKKL